MIKSKKSLSQNFIIDKNICNKLINETNITNQNVIEVGPGKGFLTDIILEKKPKKILLIEKDDYLSKILIEKYKNIKNVKILNKDVLDVKLNKFDNFILISNLPYNISSKVIFHFFKFNNYITEIIIMVQKEVAKKFDYNIPKLNKYKFYTKLLSNYKICFDVPPTVFRPMPKVFSSVIKFKMKKNVKINKKTLSFVEKIFINNRKKINNKIKLSKSKNIDLLQKRIDEITLDELFYIYNFF